MKTFKKQNYKIIPKAITKDLASFCYNYFLIQKEVYDTCIKERYISPFEHILGGYEEKDGQVPNSYYQYANIAFETLLLKLQPLMEKETGIKLSPTYSYARVYRKGDELVRHKDRASCEISTTLNLGGDSWPIYIEPNPKKGKTVGDKYISGNTKGVKVDLKPGDMLAYKGDVLEHWREPFTGEDCVQVFLHYNRFDNKIAKENLFDGRRHIGLPPYFKKSK